MMDNEKPEESSAESAENAEEISAEETADVSASEEAAGTSDEQAGETTQESVDSPDESPESIVEETATAEPVGTSADDEAETVAEESEPVVDAAETVVEETEAVVDAEQAVAEELDGASEQSGTADASAEGQPEDDQSAEDEAKVVAGSTEASLPELTLGDEAPQSVEAVEPVVGATVRGKIDKFGAAIGTGRRKTSVARVRITDGSGQLSINGRSLDDFFRLERDRRSVEAPLRTTGNFGSVDVWVRVNGGGTTGQAGAISLGIARALQVKDPSLHTVLSEGGYLTRDGRMVERKKYGYKKARKSFQFSKR